MDILTLKKAQKYADNLVITPDKTTFAREGLFIGKLESGIGVAGGVGNWTVRTDVSNRSSYIIPVKPNTTYTFERYGGNLFRLFTVSTYPEHGTPATSLLADASKDSLNRYTFTTPPDAQYLICYLSSDINNLPTRAILQEGEEIKAGVEIDLQDHSIPFLKLQSRVYEKNMFPVMDNVNGNYIKTTPLSYLTSDLQNSPRLDNQYGVWDSFVSHSPDYVSKELMWREPVENLPVYKYTLEPPMPLGDGGNDLQPIRVLIIGMIHGHEIYAALTLANFFDDLVKNWKDNEVLSLLRWNVQFDVFPIYNPYGVQHFTRVNGNGVDLNSNLSTDWVLKDQPGSMYYSGPEAMSEYENQQFESYLDSLPYSYDFAIDVHHADPYTEGGRVLYTRTLNDDITRLLHGVANQTNAYLMKEFTHIFGEGNTHTISLSFPSGTGRMFKFFQDKKIPGTLYEIAAPGAIIGQQDTIKISIHYFGNLLLSVIRNINSIKLID